MVNFSNFHRLDPAARNVAMSLLGKAGHQPASFTTFVFRWMSFNGWMSAVTLEDSDAAMIRALVGAPRLLHAYDQLMAGNADFAKLVTDFAALWPVLNVSDVRKKLGYDAFWQNDRQTLLSLCAANHVKQQPINWAAGKAPSWEDLLRTIYQVRCNLFHGEKSPENGRDLDLVVAADQVLASFIAETGCFEWHDAQPVNP